ncbi:hypothetical protein IFM89_022507 [Coptis chinensis]|uniref:Uncharacterized protein n=1 Tax=Coptis chinensis TaxID=261450 RepID=A0A835IAD9_9MAGN|nr:hypothetical protein IFM89_022507 [Coptis chinensis]
MDDVTTKRTRIDYARVCVVVDINFGFPFFISVNYGEGNKVDINLDYDWVPEQCANVVQDAIEQIIKIPSTEPPTVELELEYDIQCTDVVGNVVETEDIASSTLGQVEVEFIPSPSPAIEVVVRAIVNVDIGAHGVLHIEDQDAMDLSYYIMENEFTALECC